MFYSPITLEERSMLLSNISLFIHCHPLHLSEDNIPLPLHFKKSHLLYCIIHIHMFPMLQEQ